ncbi:hypothetical protein SDC9_165445 [bioreactor metagenome]|uniref:Uncharacterized protein n=1 Tax=bioreactor metagenome TaxID=1076179 RepID=A0A645FUB6_9ZZZZ
MAVCSVDHYCIHTSFNECGRSFNGVMCHTDPCSYTKTPLFIFTGKRLILCFGDIFISDQSDQPIIGVDYGQFLNLVLLEDLGGIFQIGRLAGGNKLILCHHFLDPLFHRLLKPEVTVCYDTYQSIVAVHYGNTPDLELRHHGQRIGHFPVGSDTDRVKDHSIFCTLYSPYLFGLFSDTHILMDHTDSSLTGDSDSHCGFGHRIHRSRHHWNIKRNISGKLSREIYIFGEYLRVRGN